MPEWQNFGAARKTNRGASPLLVHDQPSSVGARLNRPIQYMMRRRTAAIEVTCR
jgi:hypothetical protein